MPLTLGILAPIFNESFQLSLLNLDTPSKIHLDVCFHRNSKFQQIDNQDVPFTSLLWNSFYQRVTSNFLYCSTGHVWLLIFFTTEVLLRQLATPVFPPETPADVYVSWISCGLPCSFLLACPVIAPLGKDAWLRDHPLQPAVSFISSLSAVSQVPSSILCLSIVWWKKVIG